MTAVRVLVRSLFILCIPLSAFMLIAGCSETRYNPDLLAYLKAEKELRAAVNLEVQLRDSLVILQKRFRIDPHTELSKFSDHPELWIDLIEELRRDQ